MLTHHNESFNRLEDWDFAFAKDHWRWFQYCFTNVIHELLAYFRALKI